MNYAYNLGAMVIIEQRPHLASARENLFSEFANNKGTDKPAHPRRLISAFAIRSLESIISKQATGKILIF